MSRPKAMPDEEGSKPDHRARKADQPPPPASIAPQRKPPNPSERLDAMTRERIDSLEADKERLHERIEHLQAEIIRLAPENAQLREALKNAEANNLVSTILISSAGELSATRRSPGRSGSASRTWGAGRSLRGPSCSSRRTSAAGSAGRKIAHCPSRAVPRDRSCGLGASGPAGLPGGHDRISIGANAWISGRSTRRKRP